MKTIYLTVYNQAYYHREEDEKQIGLVEASSEDEAVEKVFHIISPDWKSDKKESLRGVKDKDEIKAITDNYEQDKKEIVRNIEVTPVGGGLITVSKG